MVAYIQEDFKGGHCVIHRLHCPPQDATVADLKRGIADSRPELYTARQRLTTVAEKGKKGTVLEDGKKLAEYGLTNGDTVVFKDLGPQVGGSIQAP